MKHREIKDRSMSTWVEKEMATHSSILAWEISWTERLGRLQSMESHKSWTQLSNNNNIYM